MKKGFIFSVDALGAIAVVIVIGAVWILSLHHSDGMWPAQIEKKAKDAAMVSLYKNVKLSELAGDTSHSDLNTVFCKKYFLYDAASNSAKDYSVCEGAKQ